MTSEPRTTLEKASRNRRRGFCTRRMKPSGIAVKGGSVTGLMCLLAQGTHCRRPLGDHLYRLSSAQSLNCHTSSVNHRPMGFDAVGNSHRGWVSLDEIAASLEDRGVKSTKRRAGSRRQEEAEGRWGYYRRIGRRTGRTEEDGGPRNKRRARHCCRTSCIL